MKRLRAETGTAILLITHDMGVVADIADRVAVMYAGRIVEEASVDAIFDEQRHSYAHAAVRRPFQGWMASARTLLPTISGTVPDIRRLAGGCRFSTRCPLADEDCRQTPPLAAAGTDRRAALLASGPDRGRLALAGPLHFGTRSSRSFPNPWRFSSGRPISWLKGRSMVSILDIVPGESLGAGR